MADDGTPDRIARELLALYRTGRQSTDIEVADMGVAGRVVARMRALREARGERVVGRKIGFTNTTLWQRYGVSGPMWNYVWDGTLHDAAALGDGLDLAGMPEPRIEPEVALHLARAPEPGMDAAALLGCVDRVAHSFEIVQSVFPGWRFTGAGAAAAFGLHGVLILGPWHDIGADRAGWGARLADVGVVLRRDGAAVDTGHARNVLGGPIAALGFLVETLAADPVGAPLTAGEIVTTGTLTDAHPVAPGEVWSTAVEGIAFDGLRLAFGARRSTVPG